MPTTNTLYQLSTRSEQKEVLVVEPIFILHTPRSKDNNINSESTKRNDPTKRLDKVDDATGRIQGYKVGLYLQTKVCIQTFWIFGSVKGLYFMKKVCILMNMVEGTV